MQLPIPSNLPTSLEPRLGQVAERLAELDLPLPDRIAATAAKVLVVSDFVAGVLARHPESLTERLADDSPLTLAALSSRLVLEDLSEPDAMRALRRHRQIEMARIAWRDLSGWSDLDGSLADLSMLADATIGAALDYASEALARRHGRPVVDSNSVPLLVLGMGKLGGRELNYSSDVDLVFVYPDGAEMPDGVAGDVEHYYRRLAQTLIRLLDKITADGFVFRVDMRLRPFGASGPLAISVGALESYLAQHGRDWERYAYVKARLITGPDYEEEVFDQVITPFVYRRYLDYGVFEALREMKRLIRDDVRRKDMHANIKLGAGGIREIEFIAQLFQLIRGGQEPSLRIRPLLAVLSELRGLAILGADQVDRLREAYRYLRTVENRLQTMADRQTHTLPEDAEERARLAYAMGLPDWPALESEIARHRRAVEDEFAALAWDGDADRDPQATTTVAAWEAGDLEALLAGTPLADDAPLIELLARFRQSSLYARMDTPSRQRLAAVIARLVPALAMKPAPATVLGRVLPVIQAVCRRSAYLALLNENPAALDRLLGVAGESPMLARQMAEHPLLLDELLDARLFDSPPTRDELDRELKHGLGRADPDDVEAYLDAMRRFQRSAVFRIAVADRLGGLPLMKVSDRLTDTAELVLECALDLAWRELVARYGRPVHGSPDAPVESGFAVIAYGKLGGLELGYGSDLDLVFLHDSDGELQETVGPQVVDNQRFFARLTQRLIHILSVQTSSGRLYEIDTRLRPSGASGLMVSSFRSFRKYQREQAWTWEHQALLRSRPVAGSEALCRAFDQERREVLVEHVQRQGLRDEIVKMRNRMRQELARGTDALFDLKQDPGGLADIEFLIDYWVLSNSDRHPTLVTFPDNIRQLEGLEQSGLISNETSRELKDAYLALRARIHELALGDSDMRVPSEEFETIRSRVLEYWSAAFDDTG